MQSLYRIFLFLFLGVQFSHAQVLKQPIPDRLVVLTFDDAVWQEMGSPQYPTAPQYAELEAAGKLQLLDAPEWITTRERETVIEMNLPRQGVSLLRFSW